MAKKRDKEDYTISVARPAKKKDEEDYPISVAKKVSCKRYSVVFLVSLFRHVLW